MWSIVFRSLGTTLIVPDAVNESFISLKSESPAYWVLPAVTLHLLTIIVISGEKIARTVMSAVTSRSVLGFAVELSLHLTK
jgi:hypothetical protein